MKKLLLFFALLLSVTVISADTYFEIDDFEIPRAKLGSRISVPVKAHFSGRLNAWQIQFTMPEGLSLSGASSTPQMIVYYYDGFGELDSIRPGVMVGSIQTAISVIGGEGYWDPDGDGEYESYGTVKWEAGDYDHFFDLRINVSPDFKGGEMILETNPSSGRDTRGGTIWETGDQDGYFYSTTIITVEPPIVGDVNGDGIVSIADVTELVDYLLEAGDDDVYLEAADLDGNGKVTIADVTTLVDMILNQ